MAKVEVELDAYSSLHDDGIQTVIYFGDADVPSLDYVIPFHEAIDEYIGYHVVPSGKIKARDKELLLAYADRLMEQVEYMTNEIEALEVIDES